MIELQHVYKTYSGPTHALRNISFKIDKGEFVFLTGPSGAGKSTLFKMIAAFDKPTSGELKVNGYNLRSINPTDVPFYRRRIGVIFQDFKLLKDRTVFENVSLPLKIQGHSNFEYRVDEILEKTGLISKRNQYPIYISGGEQQRVAIARAIIHQPSLLIADEPTGNLDPKLSLEIMDLLMDICNQGTTIFVATHDYSLLEKYGKRRIHIKDGTLEPQGSA